MINNLTWVSPKSKEDLVSYIKDNIPLNVNWYGHLPCVIFGYFSSPHRTLRLEEGRIDFEIKNGEITGIWLIARVTEISFDDVEKIAIFDYPRII